MHFYFLIIIKTVTCRLIMNLNKIKMKKITISIALLAIMSIVSCKKKAETPATTPATTTQSSSATTHSSSATAKEADGTTVSVKTDGVNVSTKNGQNKTNVTVEDGAATVEIKK